MMSDLGIKQVYHISVLGYYFYFNAGLLTELIPNISSIDGVKDTYPYMIPQFATIWSQFVFQDYFLLSCLEDLLALTPKTFLPSFKQILSDHANNLLIYFAFPFTVVICTNFWVLFSIDRGLIDEYNLLFDWLDHHTNHVVHTVVIPILLIELFITHRKYPPSLTVARPYVKMALPFFNYWAVVLGMKLFSPVWPYPYLKAMTPLMWVSYILVNLVLGYIVYAFGFLYNAFIWGKSDGDAQEQSTTAGRWSWSSGWWKLPRLIQVVYGR